MQLEKHEQLNMIYYRDKIPLAQVLHYLEQAFEGVHTSQTSFVKNLPIIFMEPIVDYEEFAGRIGVSTEAVRTALTEKTPKDYVALPNSLVRKDKLELIGTKIKEQINPTGRLPLLEALKIIEDEGIQDATSVLEAFGYRITWHGISTEKAEIHKPENQSK
jgi:hypothetical protein